MSEKKPIRSFRDLEVYQKTYKACLVVMTDIIPALPREEKYDLVDQLSRACKAIPRLIAEGFAKKHQRKGFQRYIDDAMAECNETIVCLEQVKDIYKIEKEKCSDLIEIYEIVGRQLFKLAEAWDSFSQRRRTPGSETKPVSLPNNH